MTEKHTIHFLLHVPKCAGTSVDHHFTKHLGEQFVISPRWRNPLREVLGNRYANNEQASPWSKVSVVSGHSLCVSLKRCLTQAEVRESVLLRDPLSYLLSFYNYRWRRHDEGLDCQPPSFDVWYGAQRRNPISRFLINRYFGVGIPMLYRMSSGGRLDYLENRLANFHFVGGIARATELIEGVSNELGIPPTADTMNVTKAKKFRREDLSADQVEQILADNATDQALYERWKDRGWMGQPATPKPKLARWDQPSYLVGDLRSGVAKQVIRKRSEVKAKIRRATVNEGI